MWPLNIVIYNPVPGHLLALTLVKRVKWLLFKRVESVKTTLIEWKSPSKGVKIIPKRVKIAPKRVKITPKEWISLLGEARWGTALLFRAVPLWQGRRFFFSEVGGGGWSACAKVQNRSAQCARASRRGAQRPLLRARVRGERSPWKLQGFTAFFNAKYSLNLFFFNTFFLQIFT